MCVLANLYECLCGGVPMAAREVVGFLGAGVARDYEPMWVLGSKQMSSERTSSVHNH